MDKLIYLGLTTQSNGQCTRDVRKRVQVGWNCGASGMVCDRRRAVRVKGNVYMMEVGPAMMYGVETKTLTKRVTDVEE